MKTGRPATRIHLRRLGCGIGGLDWGDVRAALEAIDTAVVLHIAFR